MNRDSNHHGVRLSDTRSTTLSAPWWVRVCMTGVPDRRAAMVYYWMFVGALCLSPAMAWGVIPPVVGDGRTSAFAGIAFFSFALWSTSRAVRWLDEHGWSSLN
jgi:hypothetical protein